MCVLLGDVHLVAGVAHRGDRLDVVEVAVGLQHEAHPEALTHLEQQLVLVRGVEQHRVAGFATAQDEDVVLVGAHHHLVDLGAAVLVVQRGHQCLLAAEARAPFLPRSALGGVPEVAVR